MGNKKNSIIKKRKIILLYVEIPINANPFLPRSRISIEVLLYSTSCFVVWAGSVGWRMRMKIMKAEIGFRCFMNLKIGRQFIF